MLSVIKKKKASFVNGMVWLKSLLPCNQLRSFKSLHVNKGFRAVAPTMYL